MPKLPRPSKSPRFAGINGVARQLGVERSHLWRVLTGQRESQRLLTRVKRLGLPWKIIHK